MKPNKEADSQNNPAAKQSQTASQPSEEARPVEEGDEAGENANPQELDEPEQAPVAMNFDQLQAGNFASIQGIWENSQGDRLVISGNQMEISRINQELGSALVSGLSLNIPSLNNDQGEPQEIEVFGNSQPAYSRYLTPSQRKEGELALDGAVATAGFMVTFAKAGVVSNIDRQVSKASDSSRERIWVAVGQNIDSDMNDDVYYRD
ncbi:DUF6287 domain-containing protein [Lactococcus termiticola]|nr:DUF6287 domain-containing protein [Lactococcus termiticola]